MKKLKLRNNLFRSYFYVITLGSVFLLALQFHANVKIVPKGSLHLSSNATAGFGASAPALVHDAVVAPVQKYYDVRLKLLTPVTGSQVVQSSDDSPPTLSPVTLKKNTEITVTVPGSAFSNIQDPTRLRLDQLNRSSLNNIISKLEDSRDDPPYSGRQEATITGTSRRDRSLRGESVRIPLKSLAARMGSLRVAGIQENNEIDHSAEEGDEVSDETEVTSAPSFSVTQGGILDCSLTNNCPNKAIVGSRNFVNNLINIFSKDLSFDEFKRRYESSREVSELLSTAGAGYTAIRRSKNGKSRRSHPKDGVVVRGQSIGACYNGVKTLLSKAGWIESNSALPGISAKTAGPDLKKNGFENLLEDPRYKDKIQSMADVPVGAVIVYEGHGKNRGRKRDPGYPHGHIEVKTAKGHISDYFSTNARTGEGFVGNYRKVIGVYVKSGVSTNHRLAQAGHRE